MKHPVAALIAAAALAFAGANANAQQYALTSKYVNLRAGPGRDYPVVAVLPPQVQVLVYGCIPSYSWCDVLAGPDRGWVYAGNLLYDYGNRVVVLPSVAAIVGIGIATFIIDDYWHEHYHDRPWWPERRRWYHPAPVPPVHDHDRDYRERDHDRNYRGPPRSGPGGPYPAPRPGVAPAAPAPQVQHTPQQTMRRALQQPQAQPQPQPRPQPQPQQRQPAPHPQQEQHQRQQQQQQHERQRQQQPLPQTQ